MQPKEISIVILADGNYPTAPYPLQLLQEADYVVCCDASVLKLQGIAPDYIVGDMDTLSAEHAEKYSDIIHKSSCQETNDQTKAFSFALGLVPDGYNAKIHILGTTGGREDHTLGNISLLMEYTKNTGKEIAPFNNLMRDGIYVDIVTDHGIFTSHFGSFTKECRRGQQVSIISFDNTVKIKSSGLLYPTDNALFEFWWSGTLNETTGERFSLEFSHNAPVLLFMLY
jgi:thiamine pyrophosphokinase